MHSRWNQALRLQHGAQIEVGTGDGITASLQIAHWAVDFVDADKLTVCVTRCFWQNDLRIFVPMRMI